jgi:Tol biopolymer transport system component
VSPPDVAAATDVARAILDGTPVPWPDRNAEISEEDRRLLAALKLLADVADFHRDLPRPSPAAPVAAAQHAATESGRWGHLRILDSVGRGSFGQVYRAWDTSLDREVALKILPAGPRAEGGGPSIIQEGRLLARVRHPNVVVIYGAEQIGNEIGLWMELVPGPTLDQAVRQGRVFSAGEIIDIGIELCRAVGAVHAAGLLHRDIKAQNIALAEDGRVVLMDFGSGRDLTEACTAELSGTPLYLAPEILAGQVASVRSDVYSVGVLLFHLLTGSYPVSRRSLKDLQRCHEHGNRVFLSDLRPNLPGRVASVVERSLAKDPQARYTSARDMECALIAVRDRLARKPYARAPVLVAASATVALALALLVWRTASDQFRDASPSERRNWIQITRFGDSVRAPALSPDGRMLAFIRGPIPFVGPAQIYVKELPDGPPEQATDDDLRKDDPVFSPDGSQIAYTTVEPNTLKWDTRIIPVRGTAAPRVRVNASGLTWIGEGRFLFSEVKKGVHMALMTATEGVPGSRDIYVPPHERGMVHRSALSPDGRWVLAAEMENQLWLPCRLLPFDGSDRGRPVGPPGAACVHAAWSPDGRWMYLNSNAGGTFHVWRQRFPDGAPEQLTTGPTEEHGIALTPDGRSLTTSVGLRTSTIWIHDDAGARQVSNEGDASLPGLGASEAMPRGNYLSPDRQKFYYVIRSGGGASFLDGELWEADLQSRRTRAIFSGFTVGSFDVSADGRRLVFAAADPNGRPRIWIATLDGTSPPRRLSTGDDDHPIFGPAGVIFFRSSHDGANFLYRMNEDGTGREQVTGERLLALHSVSPDGAWVVAYAAVTDPDVSVSVMAYPTGGGGPKRICVQCKVSWSQSGTHWYVSVPWNGGRTYVIAVQPAAPFPELPVQGIRSEADLAGLPIVRTIEQPLTLPVGDGSLHAFTRIGVQRNLYRIPIP